MGRTVRDTNLETRAARAKLPPRGKPYFRSIESGCHVGYRKGKRGGKWVVRYWRDDDTYRVKTIGVADDVTDADGVRVLDWRQAQDMARAECTKAAHEAAGVEPQIPLTVRDVMTDYLTWYEANSSSRNKSTTRDARKRVEAFILPTLGYKEVSKVKTKDVRDWLNGLAKSKPRVRSKVGKAIRHRDTSEDPDADRKRKQSANRVLTILKAGLNHAWHEGTVASDEAWRRVKPFKGVDAPKIRYLSQDECKRLINASQGAFRLLVQAALLTGCRYGELAALTVSDFNADSGTIFVGPGKTEKSRHVVLTDEGQRFFASVVAGKLGDALIFERAPGKPWGKAHQHRPLAEACGPAKIRPRASFHILRHTYASHLVMAGVPLQVVAANLGHADTRMTEKHYVHLAPSYVANTIRASAPKLGIKISGKVTQLRPSQKKENRRG